MKQNVFEGQEESRCGSERGDLLPVELSELKLKRVLVAADFSEGSRRALDWGAALAKKVGAEVVLVHVFEGVARELKILEAAFVDTSFREEARENLTEWQRELASLGLEVKPVFCEGTAVDREIVEAARRSKADLIVLGKHEGRRIERLMSRNVVSKVLERAACPVLVGM